MRQPVQLLMLFVFVLGIAMVPAVSSARPPALADESSAPGPGIRADGPETYQEGPDMYGEETGMPPEDQEMIEAGLEMYMAEPGMRGDGPGMAGPGPEAQSSGRAFRRAGMPDSSRFEMIHKKIEAVRIWKLTEVLNLNEEKSAKLFPILKKYDDRRKELGQQRRKLMRSMRDLVKEASPPSAKLKEALDSIETNGTSMEQLKNDEMRELKTVLTPYEQAKFIMFNETFEREMRTAMDRARNRGRAPLPAGKQHGRR